MPVDINKIKKFWDERNSRRAANGVGTSRDGVEYFSVRQDGEYEIRVLELGDFDCGQHWHVLEGKDGKSGGTIKCPRAYDGSPCPVCEVVEVMYASQDSADRDQAKKWKVQVRQPMLVLDLKEDEKTRVPRIYEAPSSVYEKVLKWITNPKYRDVTDFQTGRNLTLLRTRDHKNFVTYEVQPDPQETPITVNPDKVPNLREVMKPRSYEDIEYAMQHGEYPKRDAEEVEKPAPQKTAAKTEKAPTKYQRDTPAPKTKNEAPARRGPLSAVEEDYQDEEDDIPDTTQPPKAPPAAPKAAAPARTGSIADKLAAMRSKAAGAR